MTIPESLRRFSKANLLLVADHMHARWFLLAGDSMEELDAMTLPRDGAQDSEATKSSPASEMIDGERVKHWAKMLARKLSELVRGHQIESFHLVIPADMQQLMLDETPTDVEQKMGKVMHGVFTKMAPLEVLEKLFA